MTFRPLRTAGTRYASVLPVPVPASTNRWFSRSRAASTASAMASCPSRSSQYGTDSERGDPEPRTSRARITEPHHGTAASPPLPFPALRLADVIGHWIGRVELVVAGADGDLRDGEEALAAGDALGARGAAHRVLQSVPESPLGLALLADACDAAHLEAELALTLEELARRAPSRAEVWIRLAHARHATGASAE